MNVVAGILVFEVLVNLLGVYEFALLPVAVVSNADGGAAARHHPRFRRDVRSFTVHLGDGSARASARCVHPRPVRALR